MTKDEESAGSAGEVKSYGEYLRYMEEKYPKLFSGRYGGFDIDPGWYKLVDVLCANIQRHIDFMESKNPGVVSQVVVEQIKEKFGGLRFYYSGGDEYISGLVSMAESVSEYTCEVCGAPGKKSGKGWIRTLCDIHSIP